MQAHENHGSVTPTLPAAALATGADPAATRVVVSTRFMETMEPVRPVEPGTGFGLFLSSAGLLDIYSVGTGDSVYRLRRTSGRDSAYSIDDLGIVARMLSIYEGTSGPDSPDILGVGEGAKLTLSRLDAATGTYVQKVCQPAKAATPITQLLATKVRGTVYANVLLEGGIVANSFLKEDGQWASSEWVPIIAPDGSSDAKALAIAMCANNRLQNALYAISEDRKVWFSEARTRGSKFTDLGYLEVHDISVLEDSEGLLNIFALGHVAGQAGAEDKVWVKRQRRHSSVPGTIEWEDWAVVADQAGLEGLRTTLDSQGVAKVFVVETGGSGRLLLIRESRDSRGRRQGWSQVIPLGNPVPGGILEVAQNATGLAEAYLAAVGTDTEAAEVTVLYRFWQDEATSQWLSEPIRVPESTDAISLPTHAVQLEVLDGDDLPVAMAELTLSTSTQCTLRVDGRSYPVSPLHPVELKTDPSGRVVVCYLTTSLAAPSLLVTLDGMRADEGLTIEPNAELQQRLHGLTSKEVLEAKDASGRLLLQGSPGERQQNADAIAGISNRAMSLGTPGTEAALGALYIDPESAGPGLRYHQGLIGRNAFELDPAQVREQHWRVSFPAAGRVALEDLDAESVAARLGVLRAESRTAEDLGADGIEGFLGIDWGDLWESIRNGVGKIFDGLKEFVVTTIIDPVTKLVNEIKVVFHLVIDGIKYLIDKTIKLFQQAFAIVEGIWNKLKVFFKQLYEWLAFLFNLPDIRRTAAVIRHCLDVSMELAVIAVKGLKKTVAGGMDDLEQRVKKAMDQFAGSLAPGETFKGYMDKDQTPDRRKNARSSGSHNVMLDSFRENYQRAKDDGALAGLVEATGPLDELLDQLAALADNFQFGDAKQAFDDGVKYFSDIATSPDKAVNLAMAGLVKVLEAVALAGIALVKGVVLTIFDLLALLLETVRKAMNYGIEIPVVSQIYKLFTGKDLRFSMLEVTAFIVAIPANIVYKAAMHKAPFPSDSKVDEFRSSVTAEALARAAGLTTQVAGSRATDAVRSSLNTWQKVLGWILFGVFLVRMVVEPAINAVVGLGQIAEPTADDGGGGGSGGGGAGSGPVAAQAAAAAPVLVPAGLAGALEPEAAGGRWGFLSKLTDFAKSVLGLCNVLLRGLTSFCTTPWLVSSAPEKIGCSTGPGFGGIVWLLQAICGPFVGLILWFVSLKASAKGVGLTNIIRLTLWGVIHFVLVVIQAIAGGFASGVLIARGIIGTLAPQALWFCLCKPVVSGTKTISIWVLAALSAASMLANAVLTAIAVA